MYGKISALQLAALAILASAAAAHAQTEPATQADKFTPGQETSINDSALGGAGHYLVYVPSDYTADRAWPIIFCYHGLGRPPSCWPFKESTDGRGFIVVGMEYVNPDMGQQNPAQEMVSVKRIAAQVAAVLKVDDHHRFIGGFSQGGWVTSALAEQAPEFWGGVVILGAGRDAPGMPKSFRGKPVFIGVGANDANLSPARLAADFYQRQGAQVTYAEFAGIGPTVEPADARLRLWLKSQASAANNHP